MYIILVITTLLHVSNHHLLDGFYSFYGCFYGFYPCTCVNVKAIGV